LLIENNTASLGVDIHERISPGSHFCLPENPVGDGYIATAKAWKFLCGFEPSSLCDWPGKISAVLFFGGCNLRCPTCHNASIAYGDLSRSPALCHAGVLRQIKKNRKWLDGLVLSGGEATILPALEELLLSLSTLGLPLKIDTNGMNPAAVKMALKHDFVQLVAVDVKGPWEKYPNLCGGAVSSRQGRTNLEQIFSMASVIPERFTFRCTKVPDLTREDIRTVKSYLPPGLSLKVQGYFKPGHLSAVTGSGKTCYQGKNE
jgi:pyruvate formate lyase activating enzyme